MKRGVSSIGFDLGKGLINNPVDTIVAISVTSS
jgi:hypothetical protein